jgi:protein O-mannosyl-transferase
VARRRAAPAWVLALLLAALAVFAYAPGLDGVLVLDDIQAIVRNPTIRALWPLTTPLAPPPACTVSGRPIANLSFAVNYAFAPDEARDVFAAGVGAPPETRDRFLRNIVGYHALNIAIHVVTGLLLFGVVRRTLCTLRLKARFERAATGLAFAVAAIWLAHPLATSAVTYVVQRVESLMSLFYVATLYCAIRAGHGPRRWLWAAGAFAACALGMASKEVMVTAPVAVGLWTWMFGEDDGKTRWRLTGALAATWVVFGVLVWHERRAPSISVSLPVVWQYLMTQTEVLTHYLRLAVVPSPLVFLYTWPLVTSPMSVMGPATLVIVLLALTVVAVARRQPAGFLGAWFFLILSPTSSAIPIVTEVAAEHRMYLPLAAIVAGVVVFAWLGLEALAARTAGASPSNRRPVVAVATALFVVLVGAAAVTTRARNGDYTSELRLWEDTVAKQPLNSRARVAYGEALGAAGQAAAAETQLRRALELDRGDPRARVRLGVALAEQDRIDEAIAAWEEQLTWLPGDIDANRFLGQAYARRRQDALAFAHLQRVRESVPDDPSILGQLSWLLADSSDPMVRNPLRAVELAERAVAVTGHRDPRSLQTLAIAQAAAGRFDDAAAAAAEALTIARSAGDGQLATQIDWLLQSIRARGQSVIRR